MRAEDNKLYIYQNVVNQFPYCTRMTLKTKHDENLGFYQHIQQDKTLLTTKQHNLVIKD